MVFIFRFTLKQISVDHSLNAVVNIHNFIEGK